jgi:hypothetical protein
VSTDDLREPRSTTEVYLSEFCKKPQSIDVIVPGRTSGWLKLVQKERNLVPIETRLLGRVTDWLKLLQPSIKLAPMEVIVLGRTSG